MEKALVVWSIKQKCCLISTATLQCCQYCCTTLYIPPWLIKKLCVFASLSRCIVGQRVPAQNGIWVWRLCNICRLQTLYLQKMTSVSLSQYFTSCSQHHHDYHLISPQYVPQYYAILLMLTPKLHQVSQDVHYQLGDIEEVHARYHLLSYLNNQQDVVVDETKNFSIVTPRTSEGCVLVSQLLS